MIERLRHTLDAMGYELGSSELLDILWLARAINGSGPASQVTTLEPSAAHSDALAPLEPLPADAPLPDPFPAAPSQPARHLHDSLAPAEGSGYKHRLFTAAGQGSATGSRARVIRAPAPRALPGLQGLARALRPLRRYRNHRYRTIADIEATVRFTAESGVLDVIERPEQELRHTAVLLVDDSPSMRVWQPLVREVRRLLERGGIFRAVHVHRFYPNSGPRPGTTPRAESPITFLLTDGVNEAWRGTALRRFLHTHERSGPLVVVSPLPRRLWRGTAFDAQPQLLVAGRPFTRDKELGTLDPLGGSPIERPAEAVPIPVIALSPTALAAWARLLTRPGMPQLVDTVVVGEEDTEERQEARHIPGPDDATPLPAAQLLERFRASFSPEAYRLAVRLSAIRPLSAPVIQLVRIATLPTTSSGAVAEVLLGELLEPLEDESQSGRRLRAFMGDGSGDMLYDFKPGVRDLLAGGLSTEQSIEVVEAVGKALEPHLGRMPDFVALLADSGGSTHLSPQTTEFAALVSPVLDRLSGRPVAAGGDASGRDTAVEIVPHVQAAPLRFTVFGPELAWRREEPVPTGGAQQRAVLAALLLHEGENVTTATLVDALWGEDAPPSASATMRQYVRQLNRILAPSGFFITVDRQAQTYQLQAQPADTVLPLDLAAAKRLHAEAESTQASGDLAGARRLIAEALDQLHGEPLEGLPGPDAEVQRARLEEWRGRLIEYWIELGLETAAYAEIIPELEDMISRYPLREHLRALLMLSLYRSGRAAEALAVFADVRRLLAEEAGIDPSTELQELQQRIIRREPPKSVHARGLVRSAASAEPSIPSWPPPEGVCFAVLGPLRVRRDNEAVSSGSRQQQALLAVLLLRGRLTSASELIDALWGEEPPSRALAALRTYAARLRKVLGPGVLVSESGGYALNIDRDALDLFVAQDLAAESERAREVGDLARARALIGAALDLWDGEPLVDIPGPFAETQRTRVTEWHLGLIEYGLELDLALGNHADVVSQLTALTAKHPLRERLCELLMVALYQSGRQAEALAVYADMRRLVAEELGIDPHAGLKELHERVLQADASLLPESQPASAVASEDFPRPSQLPAALADFTGRTRFVSELADMLSNRQGPVVVISTLGDIGGAGKTTLAVHVAQTVRPQFPDGQLYVDLRGTGLLPAEPETVLGSFLRSLGVSDSSIPDSLEERAALYRATLAGRRVLVLLDNARDAAQVRPLLPDTEGCAVLITSRSHMVGLGGLEGRHRVNLDVMPPEEGLLLFTKIAGKERVAEERQAALDVIAACGFLPLAIRIAASLLTARKLTISTLAIWLAEQRRRVGGLRASDLALRAAFEFSYGQLVPAQARAFRLLSLTDSPDISLAAAAAVLNLAVEDTEDLLESLVDMSLLESTTPGRYRYYHDLLHLFAREWVLRGERPATEPEMALSRLLDFYLATATQAYGTERPGDRLVDHLEATAHAGLIFRDRQEAVAWLHDEGLCLLACARQSTAGTLLHRAVDLMLVTRDLGEWGALSRQYELTVTILRNAAEAIGDTRVTARAALILVESQTRLGRFETAEQQAESAVTAAEASGDTHVMSRLANLRGTIALYQNRNEDAATHFEFALNIFRANGDRAGEASVLCNLSRVRLAMGDTSRALSLAEEGVVIYDSLGLSVRGTTGRYALGLALNAAGRHSEAREVLNEARKVFQENRQQLWEGQTYFRLAEVDLADQRPGDAAAHAEKALIALADVGGTWRRANILTVLGHALNALGATDRARACWQEALSLFDELNAAESRDLRRLLAGIATSSSRRSAG
ncbi:SAV_2336 N-terminal domain-related protein [Streptomyces lannensis]|uniref:OmpR/PhoB-type domain-containing protein n=1 Tax=Streptomyces lannensis TaxID=766498 RepID=A0ABP7KRZ7_9ACTN